VQFILFYFYFFHSTVFSVCTCIRILILRSPRPTRSTKTTFEASCPPGCVSFGKAWLKKFKELRGAVVVFRCPLFCLEILHAFLLVELF
jgi:hypothetical protein